MPPRLTSLTAAACALLALAADARAQSASATGAFTTTIPIEVPAYGGREPRLDLTYNSSGGDGVAGLGWSLGGVSFLERSSSTEGLPRYAADDRWVLDGERLFPCDSPDRAPGCVTGGWYPEHRRAVQIVDEGAAGWVVRLPDGGRREYRTAWRTPDGEVFRWLLTDSSDLTGFAYGEKVHYTYSAATNLAAPRLTAVDYGWYHVGLTYETRPDPWLTAIGRGRPVPNDQRLVVIDETYAGQRIRAYRLRYATSATSGRSLLTSVQQFGTDAVVSGTTVTGGTPRETAITYPHTDDFGSNATQAAVAGAPVIDSVDDGVVDHATLTLPAGVTSSVEDCRPEAGVPCLRSTSTRLRHLSFDFNGDLVTDHVVMYWNETRTWLAPFLARGDGTYRALPIVLVDQPNLRDLVEGVPADINGDRISDLLVVHAAPSGWYGVPAPVVESFFYEPHADRLVARAHATLPWTWYLRAWGPTRWKDQVTVADVNGDGVADLVDVLPRDENDRTTLAIFTAIGRGDGTFTELTAQYPAIAGGVGRALTGDFDGDGADDLVWIGRDNNSYTEPSYVVGDHTVSLALTILHGLLLPGDPTTAAWQSYAEQFDTSSGWVGADNRPMPLRICSLLSAGAAIRWAATPYRVSCRSFPEAAFSNRIDGWHAADFDGDGVTDLAHTYAGVLRIYRFDGDAARLTAQNAVPLAAPGAGGFLVGDVDGDGADDLTSGSIYTPPVTRCLAPYEPGWQLDGPACQRVTVTPAQRVPVRSFVARTLPGNGRIDLTEMSSQTYLSDRVRSTLVDSVDLVDAEGDGGLDIESWDAQVPPDYCIPDGNSTGWRVVACDPRTITFDIRRIRRSSDGPTRWLDGDVDNDGDVDRIRVGAAPATLAGVAGVRSIDVLERQPDNRFIARHTDLTLSPERCSSTSCPRIVRPGRSWRLGDIDGDGRLDLTSVAIVDGTAHFLTLRATATGWAVLESSRPAVQALASGWYAGDFDGDGRADWASLSIGGGETTNLVVTRYASAGDGTFTASTAVHSVGLFEDGDAFTAGWITTDVDGDRADDLVHVYTDPDGNYRWISTVRLAGTPSLATTVAYAWGTLPQNAWHPANLDGDGAVDLVALSARPHPYGSKAVDVDTLTSNGDGTFSPYRALTADAPADGAIRLAGWVFADTDLDGLTDLLHVTWSPEGQAWWFEHRRGRPARTYLEGVGTAFVPGFVNDRFYLHAEQGGTGNLAALGVVDLIGDRVPEVELFQTRASGVIAERLWRSSATSADLATQLLTPAGARVSAYYAPMRYQAQLEDPAAGCRLPPGAGDRPVVIEQFVDARAGDPPSASRLAYACPAFDARRGHLGWRVTTATDGVAVARPALTTTTTASLTAACGARPLTREQRAATGDHVTDSYTYDPIGPAPYRCAETAATVTTTDAAGVSQANRVEQVESAFGDIEWVRDLGDPAVSGDERTVHFERSTTGDFVRNLDRRVVYAGTGAGGTALEQVRYTHDWRGLVVEEATWNDVDAAWVVTTTERDWRGNPVAVTDRNGETTHTTFDWALGLYPETVTDPLGHVTTQGWDLRFGALLWTRDANQKVTQHYYDALGRRYATTTPDGGTHYELASRGYNPLGAEIDVVTRYEPIDSGRWTWQVDLHDGLGRTVSLREGTAEGTRTRELHYDGDLLYQAAAWHDGSVAPSAWTTTTYDAFSRVVRTTLPDGATTATRYATGLAVDVDSLGNEARRRYDARGNLIQLDEPHAGGWASTRYTYDLRDDLVEIRDAQDHVTTMTWDSLGRRRVTDDPDLGHQTFTYDGNGNQLERTDGAGVVTSTDFDALDRPILRTTSADARTLRWIYDQPGHGAGVGRLTSVLDSAAGCAGDVETSLDYDAVGTVTRVQRCHDGVSGTITTTHNLARQATALVYPDGESVTFAIGNDGRVSGVPGLVTTVAYDADGELSRLRFVNGVEEVVHRDPLRGWIDDLDVHGATAVVREQYGYDLDGRLTRATRTGSPERTYAYDAASRLVSATGPIAEQFAYDSLSNLTSSTRAGSYQYGARPHAASRIVDSAGTATDYTYDLGGHLVLETRAGSPSRALAWDPAGRLTQVSAGGAVTRFAYDSGGNRVLVTEPSGDRTFELFPFAHRLVRADGSGGWAKQYVLGSRVLARREPGGPRTFLHGDRLGTTIAATDEAGATVARYDYTAFGEPLTGDGAAVGHRLFGGERRDPSTGLVFLAARYYDPATARFVSADNVTPALGSLGQNRYAYAYQNPLAFTDPSGHAAVGVDADPVPDEATPGPGDDVIVIHEKYEPPVDTDRAEIVFREPSSPFGPERELDSIEESLLFERFRIGQEIESIKRDQAALRARSAAALAQSAALHAQAEASARRFWYDLAPNSLGVTASLLGFGGNLQVSNAGRVYAGAAGDPRGLYKNRSVLISLARRITKYTSTRAIQKKLFGAELSLDLNWTMKKDFEALDDAGLHDALGGWGVNLVTVCFNVCIGVGFGETSYTGTVSIAPGNIGFSLFQPSYAAEVPGPATKP